MRVSAGTLLLLFVVSQVPAGILFFLHHREIHQHHDSVPPNAASPPRHIEKVLARGRRRPPRREPVSGAGAQSSSVTRASPATAVARKMRRPSNTPTTFPGGTVSGSPPLSSSSSLSPGELYIWERWREASAEVKRMTMRLAGAGGGGPPLPPLHTGPFARDLGAPGTRSAACLQEEDQDQSQKQQPRPPLSVATYNLWNVNEPWEARLKAVAALVESLKPDVLALQEVRVVWPGDGAAAVNMLDHLASMLPAPYNKQDHRFYAKVMDMAAEEGREEGLGFISRFPLLDSQLHWLRPHTSVERFKGRGVLRVKIDAGGRVGPVQVYNTHFGIDDVEQCHSVLDLLDIIQSTADNAAGAKARADARGNGGSPQIVVGDFNAYHDFQWPMDWLLRPDPVPDILLSDQATPCGAVFRAPRARALREKNQRDGHDGGSITARGGAATAVEAPFRDVFPSLYPPSTHVRLKNLQADPDNPGYTFPVFGDARIMDRSRVDRILIKSSPAGATWAIEECGVGLFGHEPIHPRPAGAPGGRPIFPSDHLGVLAWFTPPVKSDFGGKVDWTGRSRGQANERRGGGSAAPARPRRGSPVPVALGRLDAGSLYSFDDAKFGLAAAADGELDTYFWSGRPPLATDVITLKLDDPFECSGGETSSAAAAEEHLSKPVALTISAYTGKPDETQPTRPGPGTGDALASGTLVVSSPSGQTVASTPFRQGVAVLSISSGASISAVYIKVDSDQEAWLVVRDIIVSCQ